ncbi:MAG: GNAT family N-acyltransferase [Alphaproteobacteria bacterium]
MQPLTCGLYSAQLATSPQDMAEVLALRHLCFRAGRGTSQPASDADHLDAACRHVLLRRGDQAVGGFRAQIFAKDQSLSDSYAAQFYDLTRFQRQTAPKIELGRFCVHPDHSDPDILRLAWASLTCLVDLAGADLLFGCTSFDGCDPTRHLAALAYLACHHLGPETVRPGQGTARSIDLTRLPAPAAPPRLPPLLRSYLAMGGWVSDHAVLDPDLDTTHVFTALTIAAIPAPRARALRALAQSSG